MLVSAIPASLLVIVGAVLGLEQFTKYGGLIFISLVVFAVPYVQMVTMFGFIFKKSDTAYKYIIIPIGLLYGVCELIVNLLDNEGLSDFINYTIPIATLSRTILAVVDLND